MRHLDRTGLFALVLIVACHTAGPDAAPAADGTTPGNGFAGNEAAGSGDAGSGAAGGHTAGASGGSTEAGGAAGHFCQGAGGFANAYVVQGTNEACTLGDTGACTANTAQVCCPVKGAHYRWNSAKNCRSVLPLGGEVATCALMDFSAPPGNTDPCSYTPAPRCFRFNGTNNLEVIVSADYWKPSQIGLGWELCTDDFEATITAAADCP
jgi:hypothetical protein